VSTRVATFRRVKSLVSLALGAEIPLIPIDLKSFEPFFHEHTLDTAWSTHLCHQGIRSGTVAIDDHTEQEVADRWVKAVGAGQFGQPLNAHAGLFLSNTHSVIQTKLPFIDRIEDGQSRRKIEDAMQWEPPISVNRNPASAIRNANPDPAIKVLNQDAKLCFQADGV
jgi:hypothetical protein